MPSEGFLQCIYLCIRFNRTDTKLGYTYSGHLELLVKLDFHHTLLLLGCPLMILTLGLKSKVVGYSCHFLKVNLRDHGNISLLLFVGLFLQGPIAEWSTNP